MKPRDVKLSKAHRDECCATCGYPFDTGDDVWVLTADPGGGSYCGATCATKAQKRGKG